MIDLASFGARPAIAQGGVSHSYGDLARHSALGARHSALGARSSALGARHSAHGEARVVFLVPPGFTHVAVQHAIWQAGAIAVPLALSHPARELEYILDDCAAGLAIASPALADRLRPLAEARQIPFLTTDQFLQPDAPAAERRAPSAECRAPSAECRVPSAETRALIVYTSGTTGRPKGVVTTRRALAAQIETLVNAWGWTANDRSLHVLPLHHIHGIVNALSSALWVGACVEFLDPFEPTGAWDRLASGEITVFTAVPTIYNRLIAAWDAADAPTRTRWSAGARGLRLMMSGSAALPVNVLTRWEAITGHRLLERYGMTEIGMALSNPLHGERRAGTVGQPLPNVEIRLTDEHGTPAPNGQPGQIEVRGPQVFQEYWGRPDETARSFRAGWFVTGDVAVLEAGYYRILGRQSVDIIKSAGYKISALEIEELAREHPDVADCAIVALPDPDLGERVAAVVVAAPGTALAPEPFRAWLKERLAPYKVPKDIRMVPELPRNAMGKVVKQDLRRFFGGG